jgi:CRISPR/Cas system CMR-associated protein Cmr5 small subunit
VSATATSKSREQRRAYMASELVRDIASGSSKRRVDGKKFASLVYGLPVMVLSNGLLQTVAFLGAKAGPRGADGESAQHRVLLDAIADDLRSFGLLGRPQAPYLEYLQMQEEVISFAHWVKRFATAQWGKQEGNE